MPDGSKHLSKNGNTSAESSSRNRGATGAGRRDSAPSIQLYGFQPPYSDNSEGHPNSQKGSWVPFNHRGAGLDNRAEAVVAEIEAAAVGAAK